MDRIAPCLLLFLITLPARADVGLLLQESTGKGMSWFTSAGHSSVYVSNICMETPTRLRLCNPNEQGSVIGSYITFGETESFEWNIVPLNIYLYGVEDTKNIPLYADVELLNLLRENYRKKYLTAICPAETCGNIDSEAHWRDTVGSAFNRDIYSFRVKTTREQDAALIDRFNAAPNVNRYNGFTNNCADFARTLINLYFPGAARRDRFNDFGMTSPKAIAKSVARFGAKHPELAYSVEKFAQLPGPIKRSDDCRKGTELSFRSKKWLIPMLMRPHELGAFIAIYAITGRFNPDHEYTRHFRIPEPDVPGPAMQLAPSLEARKAAHEATFGSHKIWADYNTRFASILDGAVRDGVFRNQGEVTNYFNRLARESTPEIDDDGALTLRSSEGSLGLTRATILSPNSDRALAYKVMLAKVHATLASAPKNRETLQEFQSDWDILTRLRQPPAGDSAAAMFASPHAQ